MINGCICFPASRGGGGGGGGGYNPGGGGIFAISVNEIT